MTTNANKHGLRAAAAQRSKKHAQRTPLPPKPGVIEDAKEVLATVLGKPAEDKAKAAEMDATAGDAKSWGKVRAFQEKAVAAKWEASMANVAGAVEVTVTRGAETIVQAWLGGVWQYDASVYAYGDRTTKPRNAAGALKLLGRTAEDAKRETAKVASNRHFRKAEPKGIVQTLETAQRSLPFDPTLATDEEILGVIAGQAVVWYNRLSRGRESAIVGRSGGRMTVNETGERVVTICCPVTGFRSFLVTALLKVGRGKSLVTKGSEHAAVEVA